MAYYFIYACAKARPRTSLGQQGTGRGRIICAVLCGAIVVRLRPESRLRSYCLLSHFPALIIETELNIKCRIQHRPTISSLMHLVDRVSSQFTHLHALDAPVSK